MKIPIIDMLNDMFGDAVVMGIFIGAVSIFMFVCAIKFAERE